LVLWQEGTIQAGFRFCYRNELRAKLAYWPKQDFGLWTWLPAILNGSEVIDSSIGVASAESKRRHVAVGRRQAVLQTLSEIVIVKLVLAQYSKWRRVNVWARACCADGMTASAHGFKHGLRPELFAIHGVTNLAASRCRQKQEAEFCQGAPLPVHRFFSVSASKARSTATGIRSGR